MLHNAIYTVYRHGKKIFKQKYITFFINYNLTPLDMNNELSQVYCIKKLVSMIRKYHNHTLHPYPRHRKEEPQNIYSSNTSIRQ